MNSNMNKELAIQKGLIINNNNSKYIKLENTYKYLFEYWLVSQVNLKKYNQEIKNSRLDFGIPNPTSNQLISGLNEYLNLEYIYIINNFFIEKLDINDINILNNYSQEEPNEKEIDLIKRTYKEIIKNNYFHKEYTDKIYNICYGYAIPSNFAPNNNLVLKIYYSKNKYELDNEKFIENISLKKDFLNRISENITKDIKNKLDIDVTIMIEKIPN